MKELYEIFNEQLGENAPPIHLEPEYHLYLEYNHHHRHHGGNVEEAKKSSQILDELYLFLGRK